MVLINGNYPQAIGSFRKSVVPPLNEPSDGEQVTVAFALEWLPYLLGALTQLTLQATWNAPTNDEVMLAQRRGSSLIELIDSTAQPATVPTPFWDEEQDLDDQMPTDMQPWYGEVTNPNAPADELTFVENAAIWALTGFIAYSGNIGGAIFFNTVAPRFVLAIQRGDIDEVIRVIIDSVEYDVVDTAGMVEGEVIEIPILADDALSSHDVLLVRSS